LSGIEQIHYKEVMLSCNCYVTWFGTVFVVW
jgi:hypothetical protein